MQEREDYCLISGKTPLISNLNMVENIALIKEVHQRVSIKKAQQEAFDMLAKLGYEYIVQRRMSECTFTEIFYVMYIRALMMEEKNIIIQVPHSITDNIKDIKSIIEGIDRLNTDKVIEILDLRVNETHYKGCACNIIK